MISVQCRELAEKLGVYDRNTSDKEVGDRILQNVKNVYAWVSVQTFAYQFPGTSLLKEARVITVKPNSWEALCHFIALLWTTTKPINQNRVILAILGSGDQQDVAHLRAAAQKNWAFMLYLSLEGDHFEATAVNPQIRLCNIM